MAIERINNHLISVQQVDVVDLSPNALPIALFSFLFDFQAGRGTAPVSQFLDHSRKIENKPFQLLLFC